MGVVMRQEPGSVLCRRDLGAEACTPRVAVTRGRVRQVRDPCGPCVCTTGTTISGNGKRQDDRGYNYGRGRESEGVRGQGMVKRREEGRETEGRGRKRERGRRKGGEGTLPAARRQCGVASRACRTGDRSHHAGLPPSSFAPPTASKAGTTLGAGRGAFPQSLSACTGSDPRRSRNVRGRAALPLLSGCCCGNDCWPCSSCRCCIGCSSRSWNCSVVLRANGCCCRGCGGSGLI